MTKTKKKQSKLKDIIVKTILVLIALCLIGVLALGILNVYVIGKCNSDIYSLDSFESSEASGEHYDAVIVLGCAVYRDGSASPMLADRLRTAAAVYKTGCCDCVLVSGDSEEPDDYDETGTMKAFLIEEGVPEEAIVCDPLGLSTYDSSLRAYNLYGVRKAVVVTTEFHCPRSVYDCSGFGIESVGVEAINSGYIIKPYNYIREFFARGKDVVFMIVRPGT